MPSRYRAITLMQVVLPSSVQAEAGEGLRNLHTGNTSLSVYLDTNVALKALSALKSSG